MNSEYNGFDNRDEEIAAYVSGEMAPGAAAEFERRMVADTALRREVDATRAVLDDARAWLGREAPGIERVVGLETPRIGMAGRATKNAADRGKATGRAGKASVISMRPGIRRLVAAAAIFLVGFAVGRAGEWMRAASPDRAAAPDARSVADAKDGNNATNRTDRPNGQAKFTETTQSTQATQSVGSIRSTGSTESAPPATAAPPKAPPQVPPAAAPGPRVVAQADAPQRRAYSENGKLIIETTLADSGARALWVVDAGLRLDDTARESHDSR
jgi:anti-sigma-K factor RskA